MKPMRSRKLRASILGGVAVDEAADGLGGDHHHANRYHDGGDHYGNLIHHADGRDHGVEGEHYVQKDDLHQDAAERRLDPGALVPLLALELIVDLVGALAEQEEAAEDQDQVAPGDLLPENREQRRGEPDDPAQGQEQQYACYQRDPEPQPPRKCLPVRGQLIRKDGNEDDVVDPEHDLEG